MPACDKWATARRIARVACITLAIASIAAVIGCAPAQPGREYAWRPSPNFDQRRPNFIVIHETTNDTVDKALSTLTNPERQVSSHYLIARDGRVLQLVDDIGRAWHAGRSWWGGHTDLNSTSIGIELDNNGREPFSEPLMASLEKLLGQLVERFRIPPANIVGHGDIAPGRTVDPSRYFSWQRLSQRGLGLWCAQPEAVLPPRFDPVLGLMALGYDVSRPDVARQAFRRHFAATTAVDGRRCRSTSQVFADRRCLLRTLRRKVVHHGFLTVPERL